MPLIFYKDHLHLFPSNVAYGYIILSTKSTFSDVLSISY